MFKWFRERRERIREEKLIVEATILEASRLLALARVKALRHWYSARNCPLRGAPCHLGECCFWNERIFKIYGEYFFTVECTLEKH